MTRKENILRGSDFSSAVAKIALSAKDFSSGVAKIGYRQRISPSLLPKLLYSDAIGDARVSKIGLNEADDLAGKDRCKVAPAVLILW